MEQVIEYLLYICVFFGVFGLLVLVVSGFIPKGKLTISKNIISEEFWHPSFIVLYSYPYHMLNNFGKLLHKVAWVPLYISAVLLVLLTLLTLLI